MENLATFKELGIAGIAIVAIAYVCFKLIKEITESRIDYRNYVRDNNHTTTDLVIKATETMVETKNAIAQHNELLKIMIDKHK